jgi:hypothetical protein
MLVGVRDNCGNEFTTGMERRSSLHPFVHLSIPPVDRLDGSKVVNTGAEPHFDEFADEVV